MPNIEGVAYPNKVFTFEERDVPNSLTDATAVDTWVIEVIITNRTSAAITLTLQDKQSTPFEFLEASSFPANKTSYITFRRPRKFTGGISRQASAATGLNLVIEGYQTTG